MTSPAFGDYQLEIYLAGLQGVLPAFPMEFAELEARAARALPPSVFWPRPKVDSAVVAIRPDAARRACG